MLNDISDNINTALTYVPGANGSKTALVSSYQNGSDSKYNYTYDANGNITQIWRGSGDYSTAAVKFSYEYDNANQLVRENLYYGSGNSNNVTYKYTYDSWGNLISKKRYAYTTVVNLVSGTELETITYGYSNSQWADLLTSYNGNTIAYDNMGNPTSYLGKTLAWEGKRLTTAQIPVTAGRLKTAEYAYNEDGLRLSKVYDGTTTEYYYNGSVLIGMKIGTGSTAKILCFSYDASGNVIAVDYSTDGGTSFTMYYYLRNAQNDIVKIVDSSGNSVVEYIYDSWGKILSVTGTLTATLGADQPFRYRGYVYDEETQWYYLQSRYYDPATCRFISADVLLSTGQGVIGHNSFAYCLNNPVNGLDSDGYAYRAYNVMMGDGAEHPTPKNHCVIIYYYFEGSNFPMDSQALDFGYSRLYNEVTMICVSSGSEMADALNALSGDIDDIYILMHCNGKEITGKDKWSDYYQLNPLECVSGKIYFLGCHGANIAYQLSYYTHCDVVSCTQGVSYYYNSGYYPMHEYSLWNLLSDAFNGRSYCWKYTAYNNGYIHSYYSVFFPSPI